MKSIKKVLLYGFLIWLTPFIISFFIFPLKTSNPALFESIMPLVLTICVVFFTGLYFRRMDDNLHKESIKLGVIWFSISLIIDLILFLPASPMHMDFSTYMQDIGLTYLIIPTITIGFGYMIEKK